MTRDFITARERVSLATIETIKFKDVLNWIIILEVVALLIISRG